MDEDVKTNESVNETVETSTEQPSQVAETPVTPVQDQNQAPVQTQPEENYKKAMFEERRKRQELQRELAQRSNEQRMSQFDPIDTEQVLQHPLVQELILKDAKRELTDYSRDLLEQYPTIPELVKKAILKNVKGFVNENTSDVETAKLDIAEYVESLAADVPQAPEAQKGFPIASTNQPVAESSTANLNEVNKILDKPVDELTDEEAKAIEDYKKSHK